jgi:hypothetical protein
MQGVINDNLFRMEPIVRYDPSKAEHGQKYKLQKKDKEVVDEDEEVHETPMPEVSSDRYFEVKTDLKSILKPDQGTGFSLRNMFGGNESDEGNFYLKINTSIIITNFYTEKGKLHYQGTEKQTKRVKNPFEREDSSDEGEAEEVQEQESKVFQRIPPRPSNESFFFRTDDPRFEGCFIV